MGMVCVKLLFVAVGAAVDFCRRGAGAVRAFGLNDPKRGRRERKQMTKKNYYSTIHEDYSSVTRSVTLLKKAQVSVLVTYIDTIIT